MPSIRGLAWDDDPKRYMEPLRKRLEPYGIDLEIKKDTGEFWNAYHSQTPDFVVLDLFNDSRDPPSPDGQRMADALPREMPIFLLTAYVDRLRPGHLDALPPNVAVRFKTDEVFVAKLISDDLKQRGVLTERNQVFLIQRSAPNPDAQVVNDHLRGWGVRVERLYPGGSTTNIMRALLNMNRSGAVIAIMTADEKMESGDEWRSRSNVLLEIGMAMGLGRGAERLILLRHDSVQLPSDLGGFLSINYRNSVAETFDDLESRLRYLRIELSS